MLGIETAPLEALGRLVRDPQTRHRPVTARRQFPARLAQRGRERRLGPDRPVECDTAVAEDMLAVLKLATTAAAIRAIWASNQKSRQSGSCGARGAHRRGCSRGFERQRRRSMTTSQGFLPSRRPMNRVCRRCRSGVHSRNSNCPTSNGFSHRHSFIF